MHTLTNQPHFEPTKKTSHINRRYIIKGIVILMNTKGVALPNIFPTPTASRGLEGKSLDMDRAPMFFVVNPNKMI